MHSKGVLLEAKASFKKDCSMMNYKSCKSKTRMPDKGTFLTISTIWIISKAFWNIFEDVPRTLSGKNVGVLFSRGLNSSGKNFVT